MMKTKVLKEPDKILRLFKELKKSKLYLFPSKGKVNVSIRHGVYIILDPKGRVLHVGNTPYGKLGLNQRLYNHISSTGVLYREYLRPNNLNLRNGYSFKYIEVDNTRERALLEALTAGLLCPVHFGTGAKRNTI